MKDTFQNIFKFLVENNVHFDLIEHEPVYTSDQAARVRGLSLKQGAKSLLLKADKEFVLIIIPGDKKLDSKKTKLVLNVKNLRFATPDEVKEIMNCEIGACYPFGNIIGVRMIVDNDLSKNDIISFNPGVHAKSIKVKWKDYYNTVKPELGNVSA